MSGLDPHHYDDVSRPLEGAAADAVRAELGVPAGSGIVRAMDMMQAALFVHVDRNGMCTANATIPRREAADLLRQVADIWEAEARTAEIAERDQLRAAERERRRK